MDIHYNAFISYRHHPDDIRVAMEIHRGLERFKIPKAIKKRISGPMRLFRDKEELPITSHLTDDISLALNNSDYLIVICSPHTKESVWVQREIETFLKTHSRDKVLTVLASGEPYDVIPEILLHEDVVDPITGQIQRREIEPLSCDWRMKKRKAVREELPRLAAPLLGCAYDELRQRQRQYRMRRTIAFFSVALAASLSLAIYFIHTSIQIQKANDDLHAANVQIQAANVQIQDNLDQALRNQSEYLAAASGERMEAGDRLTAIALALEALPDETGDRPYVPEAEQALSDAISAYQSEAEVSAMGSFTADSLVQQFQVTEDGKLLYIMDARKIVTVWDTVTFQKLATIQNNEYTLDTMYLTPAGNVVITTSGSLDSKLLCYSSDGTLLWSLDHCVDLAFMDDRSELLLRIDDFESVDAIAFADPDTGAYTRESIDVGQMEELFIGFFLMENRSDQQIPLMFNQGDNTVVYLLDLSAGSFRKLTQIDTSFAGANYNVDCIGLDHEGNILLMRGDGSGDLNGTYLNFELTSPDRADIFCYDAQTLQIKWQSEITTYIYSNYRTIAPIPESDLLLIQNGNTFQVHDAATGECVARSQSAAIPMTLTVEAETTWGLLSNATFFEFEYAAAQCRTSSFADTTLTGAVANKGYFVHTPLSYQVTVYRSIKDEQAMAYSEELSSLASMCLVSGKHMMSYGSRTLHMLDTEQRSILWQKELGYSWDPIGFSQDGTKLWMWNDFDDVIGQFRVSDGTQTAIEVSVDIEDAYTEIDSNFLLAEDKVLYVLECNGHSQLRRVDLHTGKEDLCLELTAFAGETIEYGESIHLMTVREQYLWLQRNDSIHVIDLSDGSIRNVCGDVMLTACWACGESTDEILVGAGSQLLLAKTDGSVIRKIDLGGQKAVSVYCCGDGLMVLGDDGTVYRYGRQGQLLNRITVDLFDTFYSNVNYGDDDPLGLFWYETGDGDLIVNAFGAGNIIDCGQWQTRAFIPQLQAYLPEQDEFVCSATYELYAYNRYSTQQQMQKAREALGDFRLTDAQKKYYGLN